MSLAVWTWLLPSTANTCLRLKQLHQTCVVHTGPIRREGVFRVGSLDTDHQTFSVGNARLRTCWRHISPNTEILSCPRLTLSVQCTAFTNAKNWECIGHRLSVRCLRGQRSVSVCSKKHSRDFSKISTSKIENMRFIFSKAPKHHYKSHQGLSVLSHRPKPANTSIYSPKCWNSRCPFTRQKSWAPDALQGAIGRSNLAFGAQTMAMCH